MSDIKQKFTFWLQKGDAEKFLAIYKKAKQRDGRTNYSEVIRELMGYPPKEGTNAVTLPEDREFLLGIQKEIIAVESSATFRKPKIVSHQK